MYIHPPHAKPKSQKAKFVQPNSSSCLSPLPCRTPPKQYLLCCLSWCALKAPGDPLLTAGMQTVPLCMPILCLAHRGSELSRAPSGRTRCKQMLESSRCNTFPDLRPEFLLQLIWNPSSWQTTQNVFVQFRLCLNHLVKPKSCSSFDLSWLIKHLGRFAIFDAALAIPLTYSDLLLLQTAAERQAAR